MEDLRLKTYWSHVARVVSKRSLQRELERHRKQTQRRLAKCCRRLSM